MTEGLYYEEPGQEDIRERARAIIRDGDIELDRVLHSISVVDKWLDACVSPEYRAAPLAQDWARVAKITEEAGEAVDALIRMTGQNPRKGVCGTRGELLAELADAACTAIFAIQHFTKDETRTWAIVTRALAKAADRARGQ